MLRHLRAMLFGLAIAGSSFAFTACGMPTEPLGQDEDEEPPCELCIGYDNNN
jgi:hypothetical protein